LGSLFSKPKREVGSEDLEARGYASNSPLAMWGKRDQELEARIIPFLPAIAAGVAGTALGSLFSKPKRELSEELFSREPLTDAQALLFKIEAMRNNVKKPKREVSDELFVREPEDWAQLAEAIRDQAAKREPSPELESWYRLGVPRPRQ